MAHGCAAVYSGAGDLALMGREIWPHEVAAFEEVFHYKPTGLDVVTDICDRLLSAGAPGLHFYTMNQAALTTTIWQRLGL